MEGIHILRDLLRAGDWMTKVDLKDAYFMVPIHEEDRAFLKFLFKERTYQFKCQPFGQACAPCCSVETTGNAIDRLHRRHPHPGRVQGASSGTCYRPDIPIREPRFCDKPTKKYPGIYSVLEFLGFSVNSVEQAWKVKKIRTETRHILGK